MNKTYVKMKYAAALCFLLFLLFWIVRLNVIEIRKDKDAAQTVYGGECLDINYFSGFSMETFDGGSFTQDDLKNARITVFNAWGPYCTNCLDEMPYLDELNRELRDRGLQIVGIQSDAYEFPEDMELAREEAAACGVQYPLLIADAAYNDQMRPMLRNALPGTWIVDSEGKILDFVQGGKTKEGWLQYLELYLK